MIKFNQNSWLKPYIDMDTNLRKKVKEILKTNFSKLMNNPGLGKTMEKWKM